MKGKQTIDNCKKVVAIILAVAVKCAFALPDSSESDASGQIKLDSLAGYTLGHRYTFDGFRTNDTNATDRYRSYNKRLSHCETLHVHALDDGRVYGIQYWLNLADKRSASEKLAYVQQVVADLEAASCVKFKYSKEKSKGDGDPVLFWECKDWDTRLFVFYVYNENSGIPSHRDGSMQVSLRSESIWRSEQEKIRRRKQEKVSQ